MKPYGNLTQIQRPEVPIPISPLLTPRKHKPRTLISRARKPARNPKMHGLGLRVHRV